MGSVHIAWQLDWGTFLSDTFFDPAPPAPPCMGLIGAPSVQVWR